MQVAEEGCDCNFMSTEGVDIKEGKTSAYLRYMNFAGLNFMWKCLYYADYNPISAVKAVNKSHLITQSNTEMEGGGDEEGDILGSLPAS